MRVLENWPRLVLTLAPIAIVVLVAVVATREYLQPESEKAIRLVKESSSRKENFTVQQYLYTTVYYRKDRGEPITIEGWRADASGHEGQIGIEFVYSDVAGRHVASWVADLKEESVSPQNDAARELSWH